MMASRSLAVVLGVCLLLGSVTARAQPSAAQKETARGLMAEGRELREQGDLQGALARFAAADSLMGVPTTGYEMAATQAELGKLVEARETLRRVLALPQSPDDPPPFSEARAKARALDQRLQSRIGALHFVVSGVAASETLSLSVDGESVPVAALGMPFRVNPGKHVVSARAAGREAKVEVDALESRTVKVELQLAAGQARPAPAPVALEEQEAPARRAAEPAPQEQPATKSGSGIPPLAWVAGGLGAAGLVVGGVAGMVAISHKNAAAKDCVNGECPRSTWNDLDSANSMATLSTVGFIVGAVGIAVGASSLILHEEPRPRTSALQVVPDVGPRAASLSVSGRF
jgi:hypothetical protein